MHDFSEVPPDMFSQTVEYALRAMVYLAKRPGTACPNGEIAEVTKVPPAYLSKVLQSLRKAGIVTSQRGVGGGVTFHRDSKELTVLEIVQAVDPIKRIQSCPLGLRKHGTRLCPLHRRMDNALKMVEDAFGQSTLAEIIAEPSESVPLGDRVS